MVSFGPGLGTVVAFHQHGNTQLLKGCDHSMMILSTDIVSFIHHLVYYIII